MKSPKLNGIDSNIRRENARIFLVLHKNGVEKFLTEFGIQTGVCRAGRASLDSYDRLAASYEL